MPDNDSLTPAPTDTRSLLQMDWGGALFGDEVSTPEADTVETRADEEAPDEDTPDVDNEAVDVDSAAPEKLEYATDDDVTEAPTVVEPAPLEDNQDVALTGDPELFGPASANEVSDVSFASDMDPISAFHATFRLDEEPAAPMVPPPLPQSPPVITPPPLPSKRPAPAAPKTRRYRTREVPERGTKSKGVVGIDLGTTFSCAAIVEDGQARILASRRGAPTVPSVVRYLEDGKTVVGASALRNADEHTERTILGSKRLMGRTFTSPVVQEVQNHFAYQVVAGRDGEAAILIDDEIIGLEDVAASILQEIRESVALQSEESINRAVITCPAHFNDRQREAVRHAGELAGFYVERVLNEPTAAALNLSHGQGAQRRRALVYDLGGGTFDVSVLSIEGDVFEVLATGGDTFLGGMDFDACIVEELAEALLEKEHIDAREDPTAIAKLFEFAEKAKRNLSDRTSTIVQIDHLVVKPYAARALTVGLRRARVERLFEPLVDQTLLIVTDVLNRAKLTLDEVDDIILVGGQSRAPIVRRAVANLFGREPLATIDPEEAVALGAARYAASIDAPEAITLVDALPLSIGVGLPGGRFKPLLARDTRLPASRTYQVRTTRENQKNYELAIFQGESDRVEDNEPLGMLQLNDLPAGPRGGVVVAVKIEVDAECVLSLSATELSTQRSVATRMVTNDTPEALRMKLGLPPKPTREELERRRSAVHNRPKSVWRWITGLFGRA